MSSYPRPLRARVLRRRRLSLTLKPLNRCPDQFGGLPADVEHPNEFLYWNPAQVAEAMVARLVKGPDHDGPEPKLQSGHRRLVVEPHVHPWWSVCTSRKSRLSEVRLRARRESNLIRFLYRSGHGVP